MRYEPMARNKKIIYKILIISVVLFLLIILGCVYWFKGGGACFTKPPFYNCHIKNKIDEINLELTRLSDWIGSKNAPNILSVDKNEGIFTFEHIAGTGDVGWTRIMRNDEVKDSLGFYTNHIDPILTPLTESTMIGSIWQWPKDSKLYNGPFFNFLLDFNTGKTKELPTRGKPMAKSSDGTKVVFLESECVKNPDSLKLGADCNDQNLSLRILGLTANNKIDFSINHYLDKQFARFTNIVFSPRGDKLAFEARYKAKDYDREKDYYQLFIADSGTGEIIKMENLMKAGSYQQVYWLDNENILYW